MRPPETTVTAVTGRRCPLHGDTLQYIGKYQLGCTGRVRLKNGGTAACPHTEYSTAVNPAMKYEPRQVSIFERLKTQKTALVQESIR